MTFHKLPVLKAHEVISALHRAGFIDDRQKGSYLVLFHPQRKLRTVVPVHGGATIKKPLLKRILEEAKLSIDDFLKLL